MSDFSDVIAIAEKKPKRKAKVPYQVPEWFKKLPYKSSDHGSNAVQKKAWRLVSEYVRRRDFEKYAGKCVSCWRRMDSWKEGQAAHFKAWSLCHGLFKYELKNLALSCPYCNSSMSGKEVGHPFGEELKRRHGSNILEWIEKENLNHKGEKLEAWLLVEMCKPLYEELQTLQTAKA